MQYNAMQRNGIEYENAIHFYFLRMFGIQKNAEIHQT